MKKSLYIMTLLLFVLAFSVHEGRSGNINPGDDGSAGFYNSRGLYFLEKDEPVKAVDYFLKAVEINPRMKHYHNNLAASYMKQGNYASAYAVLSRCLSLDERYAKALANMAVTAFRLQRYMESYRYYRMARKADPEYTRKRFEKNRVIRYLRLLPVKEQENEGFNEAVKYIRNSD